MIFVLDVETNGLSFSDLEITQIAYLKLDKQLNLIGEYNKYFYTENLKDSAEITGLTHRRLASLSEGPLTVEELTRVSEELHHGVIIGQNVVFDVLCLNALTYKNNLGIYPMYILDIINQFSREGTKMPLEWIINNYITEDGKRLLEERFKGEGVSYHNALYDVYSVYALIKYNQDFHKRFKNFLKTLPMKEV